MSVITVERLEDLELTCFPGELRRFDDDGNILTTEPWLWWRVKVKGSIIIESQWQPLLQPIALSSSDSASGPSGFPKIGRT